MGQSNTNSTIQSWQHWVLESNKVLSRCSPLKVLLAANSAIMIISNQKNGRTGQPLHQESTGPQGAVAALARSVLHMLSNKG